MSVEQPTSRIEWIDVAKGVAIMMVTAFHANMVVEWSQVDTGFSKNLHSFLSSFRMPLFFTVSGLFAKSSVKGSWPSLWNRRLETYIWLFLLWSTAFWLFANVFPLENDPTFGTEIEDLLKAILRPIAFIWFLWCLAVFFVVTKLTYKINSRIMLPSLVALSIAGFMLRQSPPQQGLLGFIQGSLAYINALSYLIFFWAASRYGNFIVSAVPASPKSIALLVLAFTLCRYGSLKIEPAVLRSLLTLMAACAGVLLLLSASRGCSVFFPKIGDYLRAVGARTVPLYVLQIPVMWVLVFPFAGRDLGIDDFGTLLYIPLALLAILIIQGIDNLTIRLNLYWLFASPRVRTP